MELESSQYLRRQKSTVIIEKPLYSMDVLGLEMGKLNFEMSKVKAQHLVE